MRLTWATTLVALLLTSAPLIVADDIHCDKSTPCEVGCCGTNNVCGTGPDYCSKAKCINNCNYKAECNPGNWPSQYFNSTKCPLNVCCSKYGFCGTTEEFCGKETVKRPSCNIGSQSVKRVIGYYGSGGASRRCNSMIPQSFPQGIYTHIYFAFGSIDPKSFQVIPAGETDKRLYPQLAALKTRDVGQELWLSIGGWTFSDNGSPTATTFSDLVNADTTHLGLHWCPTLVAIETLCNLGDSRDGMENLGSLEEALCEIPSPAGPGSDKRHLLEARRLTMATMDDRSRNGVEPSLAVAIRGILSGELSLHYMRWLESNNPNEPGPPRQVILEIGFWIGPTPGDAPLQAVQERYSDTTHTEARDRWIVVHLHIPLSEQTFRIGSFDWEIGVSSFGMYHSQDTELPSAVSSGISQHYRAEWRFSDSYQQGRFNTGTMRNYNVRMEPFNCRYVDGRHTGLWYPGHDYSRSLATLRGEGRTTGLARLINNFGLWLRRQGTFSTENLVRVWPSIANQEVPNDDQSRWGQVWYDPEAGAFDRNWLPNGNGADDLSGTFP